MKITVTTRAVMGGLEALEKRFKLLSMRKSYVKVGILGKKDARSDAMTNAELASIHEYGTSTIPARPFIAPPFIENRESYMKLLRDGYSKALKGNSPDAFTKALRAIGMKMVADIRNRITSGAGIPPPLAPSTIARKGSSRPLVDTGQMLRSVDFEVVE